MEEIRKKLSHFESMTRLLASKKLVLMIDLDHTLLHSANKDDVAGTYSCNGVIRWKFDIDLDEKLTKIRPYTGQFLRNMSQLFELRICTLGQRKYAEKMAKLLDEDGLLFGNRIHSRDDLASSDRRWKIRHLTELFPCGDHMVVIIDDRGDVWNWSQNLVRVLPYNFFIESDNKKIAPALDHDNYLPHLETYLRKIHLAFFGAYAAFTINNNAPFPTTRTIINSIKPKELVQNDKDHYQQSRLTQVSVKTQTALNELDYIELKGLIMFRSCCLCCVLCIFSLCIFFFACGLTKNNI